MVVPFVTWNEVVNENSVRNTKGIQVDTIHTCGIDLVSFVHEHALDAIWLFSNGRYGRHEPAVADGSLVDVFWSDTVRTKERVGAVVIYVLDPLPLFPS